MPPGSSPGGTDAQIAREFNQEVVQVMPDLATSQATVGDYRTPREAPLPFGCARHLSVWKTALQLPPQLYQEAPYYRKPAVRSSQLIDRPFQQLPRTKGKFCSATVHVA